VSEVVELITQREAELTRQEYVRRRIEGKANDDYSQQAGLIAYLTPQGYEKAVEVCEREGYAIAATLIEKINPNLVAIQLPRGVYSIGGGGAKFYQEASDDWKHSNRAEKPFLLEYDDVVRIEGSADELWQNVDYQWNGTPKTTS